MIEIIAALVPDNGLILIFTVLLRPKPSATRLR